jgi:hypothetical protein
VFTGISLIVAGCALVWWGSWSLPRGMRQVQSQASAVDPAARDQLRALDIFTRSRAGQIILYKTPTVIGIVTLVSGVIWLITH